MDLPPLSKYTVPVAEGHLAFRHRPGDGPCLALVPGTFYDSSQWAETIPHLDPALELILIEVRGHGESWPPPSNGSIELFAEDMLRVADAAGVDRFYAGGHSLGGMIALEAGRIGPERVNAVISIEGWTNQAAARESFGQVMIGTLSPTQRSTREEMRARATAHWTQTQKDEFLRIWHRWDGYEFLSSTDLPILEIYGDRGRERPSLETLRIPRRPNIEMIWFANASHSLPLERPKELAQAISKFIRTQEGTHVGRRCPASPASPPTDAHP